MRKGEALLDSTSEFGNEGRRSKEEKKKRGGGGMSAFDKRTGRVSAHSLRRVSSALRSKRLKDGKTALRRGTAKVFKGVLEKDVLGESSSAIIYMNSRYLDSREERGESTATRGAVVRHVICEKAD